MSASTMDAPAAARRMSRCTEPAFADHDTYSPMRQETPVTASTVCATLLCSSLFPKSVA